MIRYLTARSCTKAMLFLPKHATDEEILDVVRQWVNTLANKDYDAAFAMTYHGPDEHWTPQLMQEVIEDYGSRVSPDSSVWSITPWETATIDVQSPEPDWDVQPSHDVHWSDEPNMDLDPPLLGYVWFDLPVGGKWSDLTATFYILEIDDRLALELNDIHVM